jgi:ABC-type polysaccharide/polyol phosphate transport system ATPase subunit
VSPQPAAVHARPARMIDRPAIVIPKPVKISCVRVAMNDVGLGLDPDVSGFENIILQGMYLGYRPSEMREKIDEIAAFTELESFLSIPVRTYSSGMALRLAFAVATALRPEILLMDEWVLAGDGRFMEKARQRIEDFTAKADILVLASHSLEILRQWCDRVLWLDGGQIKMDGPTEEVLAAYSASIAASLLEDTVDAASLV